MTNYIWDSNHYPWGDDPGLDILKLEYDKLKKHEQSDLALGINMPTRKQTSNDIVKLMKQRARKTNMPLHTKKDDKFTDDGREQDVIYLTGHNVFGIGPLHTAYEFRSSDMKKPETISAVNNAGRLTAGYNNPTDDPINNKTLGVVNPPVPYTSHGYWQKLKDSAFDFNKNWHSYPADASIFSTGRNSNSFTEGLARCTSGTNSYNMDSLIGGNDYFSCNEYLPR